MPLDLPFPFTLPRLFRSPTISNFFHFPWDFKLLFGTLPSIVNYQMCIEKARNDLSGIEK